uniref:Putative ketosamine-3-kin n=1 Tax=Ixodes scapularis TaxID=6945 RepID=A0A4D5RC05_IXOSC
MSGCASAAMEARSTTSRRTLWSSLASTPPPAVATCPWTTAGTATGWSSFAGSALTTRSGWPRKSTGTGRRPNSGPSWYTRCPGSSRTSTSPPLSSTGTCGVETSLSTQADPSSTTQQPSMATRNLTCPLPSCLGALTLPSTRPTSRSFPRPPASRSGSTSTSCSTTSTTGITLEAATAALPSAP